MQMSIFILMTVIYCTANTQAFSQLQLYFSSVQKTLDDLKLVLNADETKVLLFTQSVNKGCFSILAKKTLLFAYWGQVVLTNLP